MFTGKVGPKGQILIPKSIRNALGLQPGIEVIIEVRGGEVVLTKPKVEGNYTDYYISTRSAKLREPVDVKKMLMEEVGERYGIH